MIFVKRYCVTNLVSDTSVLLYLGRIQHLDLLDTLFTNILIPQAVISELDAGRTLRTDTVNPRRFTWMQIVEVSTEEIAQLPSNTLGAGEQAVIAYTHRNPDCLAGLDDKLARQLAQSLEIDIIGLIGILIKAKRAGAIPQIRPLLDQLRTEGFRLHHNVYQEALYLSQETSKE